MTPVAWPSLRSRQWVAPALLVVIVLCLFWKLTLTRQYTWLNTVDAAHQVLPWMDFQAREFHRGRFPLWDPHQWGGQSLIGQVQPGSAYPLNWLLFLMPLEGGHISVGVLNWYWVLIHVLGALNCFWLCRDLGRSRTASVVAGAGFALGGFVGRIEWPQHLNSTVWAPLILLFTFRAWRGRRPWANATLAGAFLGISFLGGHFQVPTLLTAALTVLWLVFLARGEGPLTTLRWLTVAGASASVSFLVGALQILPALAYGRDAVRWMGVPNMEALGWNQPVPYDVHANFSLSPAALAGTVIPGLAESSGVYLGLVLMAAAAIGLIGAWARIEARAAALVSLCGLGLALGPHSVFHGIAYGAFPMMEKARNPSMATALIALGVAPLAGFGVDALLAGTAPPGLLKWLRRALAGLVALLTVFLVVLDMADVKLAKDIRFGIPVLAGLALAAILWMVERGRLTGRAAAGWLLFIMLIELSNTAGYYLPRRTGVPYLERIEEQADLGRYLKSLPDLPRVEFDEEEVPYNFGDWHGIDQFGGYVASMPAATARLQGEPRIRMLAGAGYRVARKAPAAGFPEEVFQGSSGIRVFRNRDVMPRVWTAHRAAAAPTAPDAVAAALNSPGYDPKKEVLLPAPLPPLEDCGGDVIRSVGRTANTFTVDVDMKCRGVLVVGDAWAPGWEARVDGAAEPILPAFGMFRAIPLGGGVHRVSMRYRPGAVVWGFWLSLAGVTAAAVAAIRTRKAG